MIKTPLILASASPRRVEILKSIGIVAEAIVPADIDETPLKNELPRDMALRLAIAKAKAVSELHPHKTILAADTVVAVGRKALGKPENRDEARQMVTLLSGRRHRVFGGIAVITPTGILRSRVCETIVRVNRLSPHDIETYLDTNEWDGKAGGYAIQQYFAVHVPFISGSYTNIVGLCAASVAALLRSV